MKEVILLEKKRPANQLNTVNNAISLLRMFLNSESVSLMDIEKELDISKTTAFRLATTMADRGLLYKNDKTKLYSPGILLFQLIRKYQKYDIVAISNSYIEELANRTNESIYLTVRSGNNYLFLTGKESTHGLKVTTPLGDEYNLYIGAAGKLHLAYLSDSDINHYFQKVNYEEFNERTLPQDELREQLKLIREQQYSISKGERISDAVGIAVPILDPNDLLVATIGIYFPSTRFSKKIKEEYIELLRQYANKIRQKMLDA